MPPLPADLDPRGRHRGRRSRRYPVLGALRTVGALLSASILLGAGYAWWNFHALNKGLHRLAIDTGQLPGAHKRIFNGQDENILVVGNTDRSTLTPAQQRELKVGSDASLATDTLLIVHLPANGAKADLISLPRDSYVNISGHGMDKLNAAYPLGYVNTPGSLDAKRTAGASLLLKTVTNLTGLRIDHYVGISLLGFVQISTAIGGVSVDLCHPANDTVAANRAAGISGGSGLVMSAGVHTVEGVTALEFVRQRHGLPNGDLDRTARQRYFITQALHKIASAGVLLDPSKLHALISAIDKAIFVDGGLDLVSLAHQMSNLNPANIVGKAIPFVRYATVDVGSVEILDPAQVQHFINNLINPAPSAAPGSRLHPSHTAAPHSFKPKMQCIN